MDRCVDKLSKLIDWLISACFAWIQRLAEYSLRLRRGSKTVTVCRRNIQWCVKVQRDTSATGHVNLL